MLRGEFIRGDGLGIPNNISTYGASKLLDLAIRGAAATLYFGLVRGFPAKAGLKSSLIEPTIGVGGYARQTLARSNAGFPTLSTLGTEAFVESADIVFPASGNYSQAVNRIMLCDDLNNVAGNYMALSAPFPAELSITAATPILQRTFKYRIYLG